MTPPLISILTVTYNAENVLAPTLESIRRQTMQDYEVIIMDGASTDSTLEIAQNSGIGNMTIVNAPDNGIYDAMNKALYQATGKYVLFLNAGDALHSDSTLRLVADAIRDNDFPGVVYGQTDIVDITRKRIGERHLRAPETLDTNSFCNGMVVCHQAFYAARDIAPWFSRKYSFSSDYEWCIRVIQNSEKNVYIPEVLADYLDEGTTSRNFWKSLWERFRIMCYYYDVLPTVIRHARFIARYIKRKK